MSQETLDLVMWAMWAAMKRPKPDFEAMNALYHPGHVLVSIVSDELGSEGPAIGAAGLQGVG